MMVSQSSLGMSHVAKPVKNLSLKIAFAYYYYYYFLSFYLGKGSAPQLQMG